MRVYEVNSFGLVYSVRIEMDCHDRVVSIENKSILVASVSYFYVEVFCGKSS